MPRHANNFEQPAVPGKEPEAAKLPDVAEAQAEAPQEEAKEESKPQPQKSKGKGNKK